MAPFHFTGITGILTTLAIGFAFGFVLERAGFGNAKNLAAQFYLYDMRVLKVMFTAIVTAMLLVFLTSALGWLDFSRVWVPPTYLGSAIVGGFVLGIGFIIGGYCPGTSLVSMATLKIDGMFFASGVVVGTFVFSLTAPSLWWFWNQSGYFGRWTLFEAAGVDAGVVVVGVFVMAICAFTAAEWAERLFARDAQTTAPSSRIQVFRRAAIATGALMALSTAVIGQPTIERRMAWKEAEFAERLGSRDIYIDPAELLGLIHNNQIDLQMLDVRSEADYNVFHLLDGKRVTVEELEGTWSAPSTPETIVVVMSNDEAAATDAWKRLAVDPNVNAYVLAGGINRWLDVYQQHLPNIPGPEVAVTGHDTLRHSFTTALGDKSPIARPEHDMVTQRQFPTKVKVLIPVRAEGGGCG